jgi:hypothetical protein
MQRGGIRQIGGRGRQVGIGLPVGERRADQRHDAMEVEPVAPPEQRAPRRGHLEEHEPSARPEHARRFREHLRDGHHVAEREAAGDGVRDARPHG